MNSTEQDEPKTNRAITWRTAITLRTAGDRGFLTRADVHHAITGLANVAPNLDITITGRLIGCDPDAGMPLGYVLLQAAEVTVVAHGPGVPDFLAALNHGLRMAEDFAAEAAEMRRRREAGQA